jgi:hypothetical protein
MDLPNLNIARAGTGSVEYLWLTLDLTAVAEPKANLETILGDAVADDTETMPLMGSMFRIQIAVSLHKSGKR